MKIDQRIKSLRKEIGVTQKELAGLVGVKHNTICNYEKGYSLPDIEIAVKLAKTFCCSLDYLIGTTDNRFREDKKIKTSEFSLLKCFCPNIPGSPASLVLVPNYIAEKSTFIVEGRCGKVAVKKKRVYQDGERVVIFSGGQTKSGIIENGKIIPYGLDLNRTKIMGIPIALFNPKIKYGV